jgi:2-desacetyl-2-hydroxyethyl bacteriochlorophyllide A dehydrogenase
MKAIVFHGVHDVRVESVRDPAVGDVRGAVVRITRASICGSDLHIFHGTVPVLPGTVIGHECVGIIEDVGADVRRFRRGDRVIVPGVAGCGDCEACRRGYPVGCVTFLAKVYGVSPELAGGQAEALHVPNADYNLWPTPSDLTDEQVLFLTDILPTGYFAAENAALKPGATVAVIGCGPVGLSALLCCRLFSPSLILAIDRVPERLARARAYGAVVIDANTQDVQSLVMAATDGHGVHAAIEAVGARETVRLAFELVRVGGVVSVVGVLIDQDFAFPMGSAFMKDVTFRVGLVNVQRYVPPLLALVRNGRLDPTALISHRLPLSDGARAYDLFSGRRDGCLKVALSP